MREDSTFVRRASKRLKKQKDKTQLFVAIGEGLQPEWW